MIKLLGVEFYSGFYGEQVDDGSHELYSIFLLIDVVGDVGLGIVFLSQPVEDIGDELEVGFAEVFERDDSVIVESSEHLTERTAFSITHPI